jgi:hypothetical protein
LLAAALAEQETVEQVAVALTVVLVQELVV